MVAPVVRQITYQADRVLLRIRVRQATRVFRDAAIVGEARNCFYVRESRPTQGQPFGLEDARTGLAQRRRRNVLHHVGRAPVHTAGAMEGRAMGK